jgi:LPPG:FO 2-phospho-L-lactate transferase
MGWLLCFLQAELSILVNTGDDFEYCGLSISPDLDTVCYTLAGLANPETGWGQRDESWTVLEAIKNLDGPDWFRLGDKDLATHLVRTDLLAQGQAFISNHAGFVSKVGGCAPCIPMSDDPVRTIVHTIDHGSLGFQQYFVQHACQPMVRSFEFQGQTGQSLLLGHWSRSMRLTWSCSRHPTPG